MTRICHVTSVHNSRDIRILEKECVSLAKREDNEVYLVAKGESYLYKKVNVVGIGQAASGKLSRIFSTSRKIYKKALEVDAEIYHLHDPELLMFVKKLKKKGKKVIFDSHEDYSNQILEKGYIPKPFRKSIAYIYYMIETHVCRYIDACIVPCEIDGKNIFAGRVKKSVYIDNLPITDEFPDSQEDSDAIGDGPAAVCCIGSLTRDRGIEQLIEACYAVGIKLILAGNITPESFKTHVQSKKEYEIVDYRGYCSREEVAEIYREAKIGVSSILPVGQYPLLGNLPTKVYEFMMMGMPFIISDFAYSRKIVEQFQCGLAVDPTDPVKIADAISYLAEHKQEAYKMGQNGRRLVNERFNWSEEEKKLYLLYEHL